MSFLKSLVTKHIHAAAAARPQGQEAVAVFFYGEPPAPESLPGLVADAEVSTVQEDCKTRISITWSDVTATITIDPAWDKATQMQGMRGWTDRFPAKVKVLDDVKALIESFDTVTA
ncbi:MAG TPA: hypothetical protein VGE56_08295, partial [Rhodocyclaceae bacterium]